MGYVIGGLIVVCLLIFCFRQIKSVYVDIRNRRSKKSSVEGLEHGTDVSSEVTEKEVRK